MDKETRHSAEQWAECKKKFETTKEYLDNNNPVPDDASAYCKDPRRWHTNMAIKPWEGVSQALVKSFYSVSEDDSHRDEIYVLLKRWFSCAGKWISSSTRTLITMPAHWTSVFTNLLTSMSPPKTRSSPHSLSLCRIGFFSVYVTSNTLLIHLSTMRSCSLTARRWLTEKIPTTTRQRAPLSSNICLASRRKHWPITGFRGWKLYASNAMRTATEILEPNLNLMHFCY